MATTIDTTLRFFLEQGPSDVKELSRLMGKSVTWVREALKAHIEEIHCVKNSFGANVFSIRPDLAVAPVDTSLDHLIGDDLINHAQTIDEDFIEGKDVPGENDEAEPIAPEGKPEVLTLCPVCGSEDLTEVKDDGSFMGAAKTCQECHTTFNKFNGKVLKTTPTEGKAKRQPKNPQHKINAKVEAAKKAGGDLKFDRTDRKWILTTTREDHSFTANDFANETPETISGRF